MIIERETPVQSALREARQRSDKAYRWLAGATFGGFGIAITLPGFVTGPENANLLLLSLASLTISSSGMLRKEYLSYRIKRFENLVRRERLILSEFNL